MATHKDKRILLEVADGPEGITIYTSDEEGVVDWSTDLPALYIEATVHDAMVKLGPFAMPAIRRGIEEKCGGKGNVSCEWTGREMLDRIVSSLKDHPFAGGDIRVMAEVNRLCDAARQEGRKAAALQCVEYLERPWRPDLSRQGLAGYLAGELRAIFGLGPK